MDFFSLMFIIITYSFTNVSSKIIIDTINTNISWLYLTKFYFHPIYGQIDISLYSLENTIRFFALNKQEWIEIKNDLSNICLKNELKLNQTKNETNLWSLSSSFTSIGQMHFILSKCNSSLNTTNANKSKLRMPLKSLETFRRLEPRRDVLLNPSLQSYIVSIQSSANPLPRRLSPLKRDD
ncbi:unnamed protein product [Rotaria magnacalcarata]|uniref:Uncharacterized protein n=1 Tax=Rotaria magnacalcarata TaxID=392030 RepID=A0A816WKC4_9BILA|nr:unnamed protein product [Rotaria magnacalcarata]